MAKDPMYLLGEMEKMGMLPWQLPPMDVPGMVWDCEGCEAVGLSAPDAWHHRKEFGHSTVERDCDG